MDSALLSRALGDGAAHRQGRGRLYRSDHGRWSHISTGMLVWVAARKVSTEGYTTLK